MLNRIREDICISNRKLDAEIESLRRIYTGLFPHEKVLLLIVPRPASAFERVVDLSLEHTGGLIETFAGRSVQFVINDHLPGLPSLAFRITADIEAAYLPHAGAATRLPLKWRVFSGLRRRLAGRCPLTYEGLKHRYVMRLARRRGATERRIIYRPSQILTDRHSVSHVDGTPKKVAVVAMHWLDVGGAEKFGVECCEQLHAAGYDVHVLSAHIGNPFYEDRLRKIANVYTIERQIPQGHYTRFISQFIQDIGATLLHNHHNTYFYESLPVVRAMELPVRILDSLHIDERIGGGFPRISLVWSNYIDFHHVISHRLANYLRTRMVSPDKIVFGHLAGRIEKVAQYNIEKSLPRKKLKIAFVGRMTWQKRPLLFVAALIRIMRALRPLGIDISADIVGDGKYFEMVKPALQYRRLDSRVRLLPPDTDVNQVMRSSDVLLVTSENEGVTLVAFEALKNGCMVISTDVGAQREIVPSTLLVSAEPFQCVKDCVRIARNLVTSAEFRSKTIGELSEKIDYFNTLPTAKMALNRFYGDEE